jgi:hypothetical protein
MSRFVLVLFSLLAFSTLATIVIYNQSKDAPPIDGGLSQFGPEEQTMIRRALGELGDLPLDELLQTKQRMKMQLNQVPEEMRPAFEYLLQKLEERIKEVSSEEVVENDEEEPIEEEVAEEEPLFLELNPQQLATANEFLASFEGKELGDLVQISVALQGAMNRVPSDEKIILEYVLQKLTVYIAELEQQEK